MKSKLRLAEIALTALAAAYLAGCGSGGSKSGAGGSGNGGSGTAGSGTGGSGAGGAVDAGPTDGAVVDTNGDALPGPCVAPPGTSPSGTAPLQAAGPAVASTATRPQFDQQTADANYTIAKFISSGGSVVSTYVSNNMTVNSANVPVNDSWDPVTNGIGDVSTFTPMFTVSADGTGTHTTIAAAITAARALSNTNCARVYILVRPGTYRGTVNVGTKTSAPAITLYSTDSDASHTLIVFNNASLTQVGGAALGTSGSATFTNGSSNFQAKNLTFANDYVETGSGNEQAVALLNQGDRSQFENVRVLGNQDTLYVKTVNTGTIARAYFRDSYIEGDTDFIFGRGTTVFDHCEIHTMGNNKTTSGTPKITGTATGAPSTEVTNPYGFLYISCKFTADANVTAGGTYLARQWYESSRPQAAGKMIVRNSTIGPHINPTTPWQPWAGRTILAPYPDGGAPGDGGMDAGPQPTAAGGVLYTSADYYALIGGGPSTPEPYIGEYGNIGPSAGGSDGGTTPTDAGTPDAPSGN
jgi:pectinesterase